VIDRALEVCPVGSVTSAQRNSVSLLEVVTSCGCGCDTVEFDGIDWSDPPAVIADGTGNTADGKSVGILVFGTIDRITCLEVYSFDDEPARLPDLDSIRAVAQS
jgi:hypothetical protein